MPRPARRPGSHRRGSLSAAPQARRSERALPKAARRLLKEKEAERRKAEKEKDHGKKREEDLLGKIKSFFADGLTSSQVAAALRSAEPQRSLFLGRVFPGPA